MSYSAQFTNQTISNLQDENMRLKQQLAAASQKMEAVNSLNASLEEGVEAIQLALICAEDIVEAWPSLTIRTLSRMTNRVDTLRQALQAAIEVVKSK